MVHFDRVAAEVESLGDALVEAAQDPVGYQRLMEQHIQRIETQGSACSQTPTAHSHLDGLVLEYWRPRTDSGTQQQRADKLAWYAA